MPIHLPKSDYFKIANLETGIYSEEQGYEEANPYSVHNRPRIELVLNEEGYQTISGNIKKELENLKVILTCRLSLLKQRIKMISEQNVKLCSEVLIDIIGK